jgi:hypothetical protein
MRQKILKGIIIGAVAGSIIGSFIGLDLYGKIFFGDFIFNGVRGYEAVGQIGAIIGGISGAVCGCIFTLILVKRNGKSK